ncbi:hypothetical protein MMC27_005049 [Xylographa pallens]|nr:hypothetical protein [Xylographa pallens]
MSTIMGEKETVRMEDQTEDGTIYPPRKQVIPAMVAIALAVFLVALVPYSLLNGWDRTILGTATPVITNEFNSFGDIAWYESGFLLPLCMFQLSFGRVYTHYSGKWVLIALVAIFEVGSIVSATAPTSRALIVGRVITGIGGAGITSGAIILINSLVPLQSRPKYLGSLGAVFGISSIVGPTLGGYLTGVTWRWCFWINVPLGVISLVVLAFLTPKSPPTVKAADSLLGKINQLDPLGFILIASSTVCLLFALQWGGIQYPWNDGRIIALFVLFGVFGLAFIGVQAWRKDEATVPPRIFFQRTILAGCISSFGIGSLLVVCSYYLPLWFQAIQGKSPQNSGLSLLPLLLSNVVFVIASGIATSVLGYYTPFLILGAALGIVGSALISTWQVDAGPGQWIGYQVLTGAGLGLALQQPNIAAQTVLRKDQAAIGISLLSFVQLLGGTIFVTVCQNLLENELIMGLTGKIPNFDPASIANQGATSLRQLVPADKLPLVLDVYSDALRTVWYVALALSCLVFVGSLGLEWKSVKKNKIQGSAQA